MAADREQSAQVNTVYMSFFFFQAEDGIRDVAVTGVQTCALPIYLGSLNGQAAGEPGGSPVTCLSLICNGWQVRPGRLPSKEWHLDIRRWRGDRGPSCFDGSATA